MLLGEFEYLLPSTWAEALALKGQYGSRTRALAGGTDLMIDLQKGKNMPEYVLSLRLLAPELRGIRAAEDGGVDIGGLTTHDDLDVSRLIREKYTVLAEAAALVGSPQIRHAGTVGGNVCSALPSADTSAPLMALDATLTLSSAEGERVLPVADFFTGPGKSVLRENELLRSFHLPPPRENSGSAYVKFGRRRALEIALAGASAVVVMSADGRICEDVRIVLTSSAPTPWRCFEAEKQLRGREVNEDTVRAAAETAAAEAKPRSSYRTTEEYRRYLLKTLVKQAVETAHGRALGAAEA